MQIDHLASFPVADMTVRYPIDPESGQVGLEIFPTAMAGQLVRRRDRLGGYPYLSEHPKLEQPERARRTASLVQAKLVREAYCGMFAQGHTMRHAPGLDAFRYQDQLREKAGERTTVVTTLRCSRGLRLEHRISWYEGESAFEVSCAFHNGSESPIQLEMLSSFSLGGITPFHEADAPERLRVHRFRSVWSAEGRLESRPLEELHLERSNSGTPIFSERFGQVGTMPVRKWFPFAAIEDTAAGVTWGAQLAWAGSWQMEICRQHDEVNLSGGLADREFGHWLKTLRPGESLETPPAILSCVQGGLDKVCERLVSVQNRAADAHPAVEEDLPIIFNEWCTTWGHPDHDRLVALARRLKGSHVRYLVIDAGWYRGAKESRFHGHGDWIPSAALFPQGLAATAAAIREEGLVPGLWFELETVSTSSESACKRGASMLQRDGRPVAVSDRHFWNFRDPETLAFLEERVIGQLRDCGFGYLKVDYNETLGLGCDDPDGLGEGLRQQVLAWYAFWDRIREQLPDLVMENCASGGHRLEPSMLGRAAMSSFSDAHETVEIPIIAANLHRLLLPRQSQIWAVLREWDSERRLVYSLAATFLGRMCLSGDVDRITAEQWEIALRAQRLYRRVAPIIKQGSSRLHQEIGPSWRHPRGWQALVRKARGNREALVIVHTFREGPSDLAIPLPEGSGWEIAGQFMEKGTTALIKGAQLQIRIPGDFCGAVLHLARS